MANTREMRRFAGSCRFVFNRALALQNAARAITDKKGARVREPLQVAHGVAQRPGYSLACGLSDSPQPTGAEESGDGVDESP
jgi:Helix-turn-helix domain